MRLALNLKHMLVLGLMAIAIPAMAQDRLTYGVKVGGGVILSSKDDLHGTGNLYFAGRADWKFTEKSSFFGELSYRTFRTDQYEATDVPSSAGVPAYALNGTPGYVYSNSTADIRKNGLEGLGLSVGYRSQIMDTAFSWQAGLGLTNLRFDQEVFGQYSVRQNPGGGGATQGPRAANPELSHEGLNYIVSKSSIKPMLFAGVRYQLDGNFHVDMNVTSMGYQAVNYVPTAWTGQAATTVTENKTKLTLELSIGFTF